MQTYSKTYKTSSASAFTGGGVVIAIVVTGDGSNNGEVEFKDASSGGNTLFTVRVSAHETKTIYFGPDAAYPVNADEDFYVNISNVDGVLIIYEA